MAPAGQGALWSEVLCCPLCSNLFGRDKPPVNLSCGHTVCRECLLGLQLQCCPLDQSAVTTRPSELPINAALLSILGVDQKTERVYSSDDGEKHKRVEAVLVKMSAYLRRAESERGGSVWSEDLSRPIQRKLLALLCFQLMEDEGRHRALKTARALAERVLSELVIAHQNTAHLSSNLWSAVRARGCQFLGPAMQEEVLRLILLTLSEGALIARKTLVMYIVQTLADDYPQVSKTCVGHVVQLLYRASCFNVMKRDGESSLMQLKSEFRDYESLRREHDTQIVQVAIEAGLRVSPDQWSSLLYGDQTHRSHMQSIIDKLQSPQVFSQLIQELMTALQRNGDPESLLLTIPHFERIAAFDPLGEVPNWSDTLALFESLGFVVDAHVRFTRKRNEQRSAGHVGTSRRFVSNGEISASGSRLNDRRYKTRLCRDAEAGRNCPRGPRCTYAHSQEELRRLAVNRNQNESQVVAPPAAPSVLMGPRMVPPSHASPHTMLSPTMPIIPIASPTNTNTIVIGPRQPIAAENGGMMHLGMPMVPVVIQGNPGVESNVPAPGVHLGVNQISNGPIEHTNEPMAPPGAVMMGFPMAPAPPPSNTVTAVPNAAQSVMMPTVWPNPPPHPANGPPAAITPPNVPIAMPMPAAPAPMHIDPNAVRWMQPCPGGRILNDGAGMHYNFPVECVDRFWHFPDDGCCAVTVAPVTNSDVIRQVSAAYVPSSLQGKQPKNADSEDEEQLMMRRHEIVSRLAMLQQKNSGPAQGDESIDDEDLQSHVSYTVANSVLYEDKEAPSSVLQLPPIPLPYNTAPPTDQTINHLGEVAAVSTTVLTVCPPCLWTNGAKPATVQSPCAVMQVKDTISQPLATPAIQRPHLVSLASYEELDPSCIADRLPPVIRPLPETPQDPQNVVSATLDRIVDVKERMNDVDRNGGIGCSVEKQQLKVELNIVSRQIQSLDQQTKQSCLLRELEAVDKKIEHLNIHS